MVGSRQTMTSEAEQLFELCRAELGRARRHVLDTAATALALLLIGVFLVLAVAQLQFAERLSTVLRPSLLLIEFTLVALGLRASALWLSDRNEVRAFGLELEGLYAELAQFRAQQGDETVPRGSIIIGASETSAKPSAILRLDD